MSRNRLDTERRPVLAAGSRPGGKITSTAYIYMKGRKRDRTYRSLAEPEPIGIVISRGPRLEPAPVVHAYVWGPAPAATPDLSKPAA